MTINPHAPVVTTAGLVELLARNVRVIGMLAEGLGHADSLLQPQPEGNCFNWVLGHILLFRQYMLTAVSRPPMHDETTLTRYIPGSEPITGDGEGVLQFAYLLKALGETQTRIADTLPAVSAVTLAEPSVVDPKQTVATHLYLLMWHEVYHVGQAELLRQLKRANNKLT